MRAFTRIAIALMWIGSVTAPYAFGQTFEMAPEASRAASAGLEQARRVVEASGQPGLLGLESTRELGQVELAEPIAVSTLSFNALLDYEPDAELAKYYEGPARAVVPVQVDGRVRSWISVARDGDRWQTTGFGDGASAQLVDRIVRQTRDRVVGVVHAPAFNLYLVEVEADRGLMLVPTGPSSVAGLAPGEPVEIRAAMARLAEHARKVEAEYGDQIRSRKIVE